MFHSASLVHNIDSVSRHLQVKLKAAQEIANQDGFTYSVPEGEHGLVRRAE